LVIIWANEQRFSRFLSLLDSTGNFLQICYRDFYLTLDVLLHYLVKSKNPIYSCFKNNPPPHQLGGLVERCKLLQWGPERSSGRKRFWCISKPVEDVSWKQFWSQEQCWQLCSCGKNCFQEMSSTGLEMHVLMWQNDSLLSPQHSKRVFCFLIA